MGPGASTSLIADVGATSTLRDMSNRSDAHNERSTHDTNDSAA
jgi:hypothetical protein